MAATFFMGLITLVMFAPHRAARSKLSLGVLLSLAFITASCAWGFSHVHDSPDYNAKCIDGWCEIPKSDVVKELKDHYAITTDVTDITDDEDYPDEGRSTTHWTVQGSDKNGKSKNYLVIIREQNPFGFDNKPVKLAMKVKEVSNSDHYLTPIK